MSLTFYSWDPRRSYEVRALSRNSPQERHYSMVSSMGEETRASMKQSRPHEDDLALNTNIQLSLFFPTYFKRSPSTSFTMFISVCGFSCYTNKMFYFINVCRIQRQSFSETLLWSFKTIPWSGQLDYDEGNEDVIRFQENNKIYKIEKWLSRKEMKG